MSGVRPGTNTQIRSVRKVHLRVCPIFCVNGSNTLDSDAASELNGKAGLRCLRERFASVRSQSENGSSLATMVRCAGRGCTTSERKYLRMVLRESSVLRAISRMDRCSRRAHREANGSLLGGNQQARSLVSQASL